jgi:hypothetical protein
MDDIPRQTFFIIENKRPSDSDKKNVEAAMPQEHSPSLYADYPIQSNRLQHSAVANKIGDFHV